MSKWLNAIAALFLTASAPVSPVINEIVIEDPAIVQVVCEIAPGRGGWGTAVQVSPGGFLTALHVVARGVCTVNGEPIEVTHIDKERDFATFISRPVSRVFEVDCSGYNRGDVYLARGYAHGGADQWAEPLVSSGWTMRHRTAFAGSVYPGMSGGPVISFEGKVVGIVNAMNPSLSVALADTVVCG